ncbi:hypothetical protein JXB02_01205 [Candidatus Woesearchaeota archaeon]|nr:hypothetical protein [Candidatus Woesearchaeota archaeon]
MKRMKAKKKSGMLMMMAMGRVVVGGLAVAAAPMYTATGGGTADWPNGRVTYGFTAQADADGNVKDEFQAQHRDSGLVTTINGDITNLHVDGNGAWIGGRVTRADNPDLVGNEFLFSVIDSGQGKNAAPDIISAVNYYANAADVVLEPAGS